MPWTRVTRFGTSRGDPPVFEMLAMLSLFALGGLAVVCGLVFLVTLSEKTSKLRRTLLIWLSVSMTPFAVILFGAAVGISKRHFGEWARLKSLLQRTVALWLRKSRRGKIRAKQLPCS